MRKLGVCTAKLKKGTLEDYFLIIKNIGFEAVFTGPYKSECEAAIRHGIEIDNIHAPFDGINQMWLEGGESMLRRLQDTVDLCAAYDISKAVIHLSSGTTPPPINDLGRARFDQLIDYAIKKGVKLAFENQRMLANLAYIMETYQNVPEVGFCWDTGHELCFTHGREYMPLFGDRLICVHLQDNHGIYDQDQHIIPFDGVIDWRKAAERIKNSPYTGPLILETFYRPGSHTGYDAYDSITDEEYYRRAYNAAAKLRSWIDE